MLLFSIQIQKFLSNLGQKAGQIMKRKCEQGFPVAKKQR